MRTLLRFSLRCRHSSTDIEQLASLISRAFGSTLGAGEFKGVPARVTEILGMQVGIFPWVGPLGSGVVRMETSPAMDALLRDGDTEVDVEWMDISPAIVDLLEVVGAGTWEVPDEDDVAADLELGARLDEIAARPPDDAPMS